MQIAILSDIHGNSIALDAVLDDIKTQRGGADAYWVLGDLVVMGPDPVGTLERLNELPNALFVRGNTDRYLCDGQKFRDAAALIGEHPDRAHTLLSVHAAVAYAQGALAASGWTNWLASIGLEHRVNLPDGTRALLVHAAPETDDGIGIHPGVSDDALAAMTSGCEADLLCIGHTHWIQDRKIGALRVINPGSVSVPWGADVSASYCMLAADANGHNLTSHRVNYDIGAVLGQMQRLKHPGYEMLVPRFRGEVAPPWA
jgi:predicted phosphodiesterase